jgi:hypothetical protein
MDAHATMNTLRGMMIGLEKIKFVQTGNIIYIRTPSALMEGITFGRRYINYTGKTVLLDPKNRLFSILHFDPDSKTGMFTKRKHPKDYFSGEIYEMSQEWVDRKVAEMKTKKGYKLKARKQDYPPKPIAVFNGRWLENLVVGNQEQWNINRIRPYKLVNARTPLPSDSTYRLDSMTLKKNDINAAQDVKERMEDSQRHDKNLRKHGGKK